MIPALGLMVGAYIVLRCADIMLRPSAQFASTFSRGVLIVLAIRRSRHDVAMRGVDQRRWIAGWTGSEVRAPVTRASDGSEVNRPELGNRAAEVCMWSVISSG